MNKREFIKTLMDMGFFGAKQGTWERGWDAAISDVIAIAEELDEPETLSEEWIENHTASADTISYYSDENVPVVTVEKLKNLLVPKQDKPVIPQFVIDFIESQDDPIYEMCVNYEMWGINGDDKTTRFTEELSEWLDDSVNVKKYYRACIDGYEVEKELLWEIPIPDLKTSDGHNQYLTYDPKARTYFASRKNGRLQQTFDVKDLASVPGQYRRYAELCDFKKIEEVTE